jgi:hypothetical protein
VLIAFDTQSGCEPRVDWDIELSLLRCGVPLPDWFEDRLTTSLATLLMLSLNEANPIKIDLDELAKGEEEWAATKLQATARRRHGRRRAQAMPTPKQARVERIAKKVDQMMTALQELQRELAHLQLK